MRLHTKTTAMPVIWACAITLSPYVGTKGLAPRFLEPPLRSTGSLLEDEQMKLHVGFDMTFECAEPTPMIFMVNVHPSRTPDLLTPDRLRVTPTRSITSYIDSFGNRCTRLLAPKGSLRVATDAIVTDGGLFQIALISRRRNMRSPIYRMTACSTCSRAAIARPTG
jgi:hypothetical protein